MTRCKTVLTLLDFSWPKYSMQTLQQAHSFPVASKQTGGASHILLNGERQNS